VLPLAVVAMLAGMKPLAAIEPAPHGDAAFPPRRRKRRAACERQAQAADKGRGRKEPRRLLSTTPPNDYLGRPGAGQVFEPERARALAGGKAEVEAAHGITGPGPGEASAKGLLGPARGHRGIEDGLHHVRGGAPGEGRCRARKGSAAQAPAVLRNVAVRLLAGVEAPSKAAAAGRFAAQPQKAIALLRLGESTTD
jgi:hypothetical protein